MKSYTTMAHIHSLGGEMGEITVLDQRNDGRQTVYIVDYKGVKCTAIFLHGCVFLPEFVILPVTL